MCAVFTVVGLVVPGPAFAAEDAGEFLPSALTMAVGIVGLLTAIGLLLVAGSLSKLAEGSAIAENIQFVNAAASCLGASVLAGWMAHFLPDAFSEQQARYGADLLVIASSAFFTLYFWRVRASMLSFVKSMYPTDLPAPETSAAEAVPTAEFARAAQGGPAQEPDAGGESDG